jgi:hypothetical protein
MIAENTIDKNRGCFVLSHNANVMLRNIVALTIR